MSARSRHSSLKKGHDFFEGQLHHIGRYYDLFENDVPLRIMVVGQEYGARRCKISLKERHKEVMKCGRKKRFKKTAEYEGRNPHMKGTTSVLRLLFGKELGIDYASEFIQIDDATERCHMFDAVCLVDYFLCAARPHNSKTKGTPTGKMKENCKDHFSSVLKILEPIIVVVQGKGIWPKVSSCFEIIKRLDEGLYFSQTGSIRSLLLSFTHPCARGYYNWGSNEKTQYLLNTVKPTVKKAMQKFLSGKLILSEN